MLVWEGLPGSKFRFFLKTVHSSRTPTTDLLTLDVRWSVKDSFAKMTHKAKTHTLLNSNYIFLDVWVGWFVMYFGKVFFFSFNVQNVATLVFYISLVISGILGLIHHLYPAIERCPSEERDPERTKLCVRMSRLRHDIADQATAD